MVLLLPVDVVVVVVRLVGITVVMIELAQSTELLDAPLILLPSLDVFEFIELPKLLALLFAITVVKLTSLVDPLVVVVVAVD